LPKLEQGRIVWVELPSSDGTQKKRRPAVIITATAEIAAGKPFAVVAVSTKFPDPLPADHVVLPWHRDGKVRTQLRKPAAAVCSWLCKITESDVLQTGGVVPPTEMIEIMRIVQQKVAES